MKAVSLSNRLETLTELGFFWLRFCDGSSRNDEDAASGADIYGRKSSAPISPRDVASLYASRA